MNQHHTPELRTFLTTRTGKGTCPPEWITVPSRVVGYAVCSVSLWRRNEGFKQSTVMCRYSVDLSGESLIFPHKGHCCRKTWDAKARSLEMK
jgi:hypothetical protein